MRYEEITSEDIELFIKTIKKTFGKNNNAVQEMKLLSGTYEIKLKGW